MEQRYLPRIADEMLEACLGRSKAVLIRGPKWCGKTMTAERHAKSMLFMQDPDTRASNMMLAESKPSVLLRGDAPRLIDEWQVAPQLWDAVRFEVDRGVETGRFILTGSATPALAPQHTGTGRFAFLDMRTMSLFESGESTGEVSLKGLFEGAEVQGASGLDVEAIAHLVCRGGWPALVTSADASAASDVARDYLEAVAQEDLPRLDTSRRNPLRALAVLQAYARVAGTHASVSAIAKSIKAQGSEISRPTIDAYLGDLRRLYVFEDLPAWRPSLRDKRRVAAAPVRFMTDPSLSAAALGASEAMLLGDMPSLGLLFENLCVRDLRAYCQPSRAALYHYRDALGLEADAVVVLPDGRYGLVEIKLTPGSVEQGAATLKKLADKIDAHATGKPAFLMVITSSGHAFKRPDGVLVVPIGCLRP